MIIILIAKDELEIRILSEEDAHLLVKWLSDPQVLEYYEGRDNPHNMELVHKHFFEDSDEVTQCIVKYREKDIGYIQFYEISDDEYELYGYSKNDRVFGMDQFIGETDYWNQGIGTRLVKIVCEYIASLGVEIIVMDPQTWNYRALRAYEKCGFRKVKILPEHEWHEGKKRDCWLIEYRVPREM